MAASKDDIAETSQALFCALADYVGSSKIDDWFDVKKDKNNPLKDYIGFKTKWNAEFGKKGFTVDAIFKDRVKSGKATFKEVDDFLTEKNDWYTSSILIAKALIEDVDNLGKIHSKIKGIGWTSIFYEHKSVTMDSIQKLFEAANKKQKDNGDADTKKSFIPFGDINKWCPADIYFASNKAENEISKSCTGKTFQNINFYSLNQMISDLIDSGDLLPLSLKRQTTSVTIKKVNFDRDSDWKDIEKITGGSYVWTKYPTTDVKSPPARDLKIFLKNTNSEQDKILFRHDASTATFKGEIILKGMEARGGSLGMEQLLGILGLINPSIKSSLKSVFSTANSTFKEKKKPIRKRYEEAVKAAGLDIKSQDKKIKEKIKLIRNTLRYDEEVGKLSGLYVTNKIMPIIIDVLSDEDARSSFVRMVYAYAASQSGEAGKFIVAK
jgi:hypothetical protein